MVTSSGFEITINGERIAQLIFARVERASLQRVEQLKDSSRGEGGFGHTGIK